ncbi:MAG: polyribonucleotide nucleotidyltransferase [Spirochaetes bacterium]|nr:polyribonucleotide nucleotidyltransferase [Spirochaetota bacterium]
MSSHFSVNIGKDNIIFNTGHLAKQADGAVAVSCNDTIVFASVVMSRDTDEKDFFPLTVDYREKYYASGKIPGGYIKREGRPSDRETLTSRLIDRPIRPLFPKDFTNEVQLIAYVLSSDKQTQMDIVAINAASAALSISGIPFSGPIGAVRVGKINGELVINPGFTEIESSDLDLVVAGTKTAVTMIEGSAKNLSEEEMIDAVIFAHENIKKICDKIEELVKIYGKPAISYIPKSEDKELREEIKNKYYTEIENLIQFKDKKERENAHKSIIEKAKESLSEKYPETINQAGSIIDDFDGEILRRRILNEKVRADGRDLKEVRPIDIIIGILPRAHGSAVFTRGQTQSLGVVTLGTVADSQKIDAIEGETFKRFMLHYNFPPFSVGETGRFGGTGRREIGHGMLAERSLAYVLPEQNDFPYTIRIVSEILESNGSSSMATICSGSLSMFNAGIPVKDAVAGIAMGLIMEGDKYAVLSDIIGLEDHLGDMDFKVAGTKTGITGFQMDIKIQGITPEIIREALLQAKENRLHILSKMDEVISQPEKELSPFAPRIVTIVVDKDKIGGIIGPGGKMIKGITERTGAEINIQDDGTVTIAAVDKNSLEMAVKEIESIIEEVEVGKIYTGRVKKIMDFGAFVEILPGKEGLLHISKLDFKRVNNVTDILNEGDTVDVKVIGIDKLGRIDLSRKDALQKK